MVETRTIDTAKPDPVGRVVTWLFSGLAGSGLVVFCGLAAFAAVLSVGGNHVSSDIAAGLRTPFREAELLKRGQQPSGSAARPGLHLAVLDDVPIALVECSEGFLRVVRGFNL